MEFSESSALPADLKKLKINLQFRLLFLSLFLFQCGHDASKDTDTATYGTISIAADESFEPIIDAELMVFKAMYTHADIRPHYRSEGQAFNLLMKDSVRVILVTRKMNAAELSIFEKEKLIPRQNKIASDAVALIVNSSNKDSLLTMSQLNDIFKGKSKKWSQLTKSNSSGEIKIVFDNSNSSNLRYIKEKFELDEPLSVNIFSAGSNRAVVEYVKDNKNALGIIGVSWISDEDDSTSRAFLKTVKAVGISASNAPSSVNDYYQPYQAYIADSSYPLRRELFVISREARVGLGPSFHPLSILRSSGLTCLLRRNRNPA